MKIVKWVDDLTLNAILFLNSKGHDSELPGIKIRHPRNGLGARRKSSSGVCYRTHITLCLGKDRTDAKMVLLHEIAHWVNPKEHHSMKFWDTAWMLYREFKLPMRHCLRRERDYRKGAVVSYRNSK